jgi:hypothetical protein
MPAISDAKAFGELAKAIGWPLFPWQQTAARYLTAKKPDGRYQWPEIAIVVGRQNGKTTLLLPLVISRMLAGKRVMHTAQNRSLPRDFFDLLTNVMDERYGDALRDKRGISFGAGTENIKLKNGGSYRIVAPTRGGARGPANDLVIIDELREMEDVEFIAAAEPTLSSSPNPQIVYLSNAGTENSLVLNGLRDRARTDPAVAYLEWSAAPERQDDDIAGWLEANPGIGYLPGKMDYLRRKFTSYGLIGQMNVFETEHLCRWVTTMRIAVVDAATWANARRQRLERPVRPTMGISVDPSGNRASAAIAWRQTDGTIGLRIVADVTGDPVNIDTLGPDLTQRALRMGATAVGFDPWTDAELAKHFRNAKAINGREFAGDCLAFIGGVEGGRLVWDEAEAVSSDLPWTARKNHDSGAWMAVKAKDDRPITAALAAIRAVGLVPAVAALPRVF